jgi:glycosyltransferase involved in cell wall biosynthesis
VSGKRRVHQLVAGASPGDAIYDHALLIQRALLDWGYESTIYACNVHPTLERKIPHFLHYQPRRDDVVFFHYSIGSELSAFVRRLPCTVVLIYHNVTPPEYLEDVSSEMARQVRQGQDELPEFKEKVHLALADSAFNLEDLVESGYPRVGVLPIALDEARYQVTSNPALLQEYGDDHTNLLFVGRIAPNKRQDDLIKVFYYYHLIQPESRLLLVGQAWDPAKRYLKHLEGIVDYLGLGKAVVFTGHVPFNELVTYYRLADAFVCMSEHEGFGKPLIESMYFDVPVIGYAAAAVPYTLGDAGILVHQKNYPLIAELIDLLLTDKSLLEKLLTGQRNRFETFRQAAMLESLRSYLDEVL